MSEQAAEPNSRPLLVAVLALATATGLGVAGVYVLSGLGWALLAGAVPLLLFGCVVLRGLGAK